jgi:hypothetical protein
MTQTIINLGTGGAALNGTLGGTLAPSTDDPTFCKWDGVNHLRNFGVGNLASCPVGAWGFVSDFQLDWFGSFDSLSVSDTIFSKLVGTGDQRSWWWRVDTSGNLVLVVWPSGTNTPSTTFTSSVSLTTVVAVDQDVRLRCTFDQNDGSGNSVVQFFYSFDGVTFTQLGSNRTAAAVAPFNGTADLVLGGIQNSGSDAHSGRGYYWRFQNGIGGTTQFEFDTRRTVKAATETSWTETSANARTVSLFRSTTAPSKRPAVVTYPLWAFSTDDWMGFPDDPRLDIPADGDFTVVVVLRQWNNVADGGRWVTKQTSSNGQGWRVQNNLTNQSSIAGISDGTVSNTGGTTAVSNGVLHVGGFVVDRAAALARSFSNGVFSTGLSLVGRGAFRDAVRMTVGRQGIAGAAYPDMELYSVAVFRRALSASELAAIRTYYEGKVA